MINKRSIKAISLLWASSFAGAGLAFLTQVVLARGLNAEEYGSFSSAFAMVTLVVPLAGFGVPALWLKIFGTEGWMGVRWIKPSLNFVFVTTLSVLAVTYSWAFLGGHEARTQYLLMILAFFVLGQISLELVSSKLQLEEKFSRLAVWQMSPHVARFVVVLLLYWLFSGKVNIWLAALVYAGVAVVFACLSISPLFKMVSGNFDLMGHPRADDLGECARINLRSVANAAWPFGVGSFAYLIYFQSDIVLIKYMVGDEAAGRYSVAFFILSAVYLLPSVLYQKFLMPKIHRWASSDRDKFWKLYRSGNKAMFAFGIASLIFVSLIGKALISFLFGEDYIGAAALLNILTFSAPLISVALSAGSVLVTNDGMREKVKYMMIVAVLNVALNLLAIPVWQEEGAAITTVISNGVLLLLYLYGAERKIKLVKLNG